MAKNKVTGARVVAEDIEPRDLLRGVFVAIALHAILSRADVDLTLYPDAMDTLALRAEAIGRGMADRIFAKEAT